MNVFLELPAAVPWLSRALLFGKLGVCGSLLFHALPSYFDSFVFIFRIRVCTNNWSTECFF